MNILLNRIVIKFIIILILFSIYSPENFLKASEKNITREVNDKIKTRGAGGKVKFNFNNKSKIFELNKKKSKNQLIMQNF